MEKLREVMAGQKSVRGKNTVCAMPAYRSETGSSIVNKQRELYGKGKERWNALQGEVSLVLLCTFSLVNATCSLPPNTKMKMFLIL